MALETRRPNANGTYQEVYHQKPITGSHYDKVDEATVDYGVTAIYSKTVYPDPPPEPVQE